MNQNSVDSTMYVNQKLSDDITSYVNLLQFDSTQLQSLKDKLNKDSILEIPDIEKYLLKAHMLVGPDSLLTHLHIQYSPNGIPTQMSSDERHGRTFFIDNLLQNELFDFKELKINQFITGIHNSEDFNEFSNFFN